MRGREDVVDQVTGAEEKSFRPDGTWNSAHGSGLNKDDSIEAI
jgi:hypothetical protein